MTNIKSKGFTIVELLIVIVVIAILAAISIVAYNGIQNRSKTTAGQSLSSQVAKKAEAYNTIQSNYPADVAAFNASGAPGEARLDNASAVIDYESATAGTAGTYNNGNAVVYRYCAATTSPVKAAGGVVYYWDFRSNVQASTSFGGGC